VKAAAAGNALAREQVAAQLEITRLRSLQNSHLKEQAEARQTIDEASAEIDLLEQIVGPDSVPAVEADSRIRITELHQQISAAQETLTRIFPYEAELIEATQRLTSLEAQIAKENAGPLASIKQKAGPVGLFKRLMGK
jgi:serine phosphatase RsbU (regulator of sigma subunit)